MVKYKLKTAAFVCTNTDIVIGQIYTLLWARGGLVVKALRYKPAGRGFDSRWCH